MELYFLFVYFPQFSKRILFSMTIAAYRCMTNWSVLALPMALFAQDTKRNMQGKSRSKCQGARTHFFKKYWFMRKSVMLPREPQQ